MSAQFAGLDSFDGTADELSEGSGCLVLGADELEVGLGARLLGGRLMGGDGGSGAQVEAGVFSDDL